LEYTVQHLVPICCDCEHGYLRFSLTSWSKLFSKM